MCAYPGTLLATRDFVVASEISCRNNSRIPVHPRGPSGPANTGPREQEHGHMRALNPRASSQVAILLNANAKKVTPRVKARIDKNRAECIVVDPRRTLTAEAAHLHIPAKPGTDLALLNGLLHLLRERGRLDRAFVEAHTEGWAELDAMLDQYPPQWVAKICSIDESLLQRAADILGQASKLITFWTMGANQSIQGTFNTNAICNLHLALGQIGRPGCGPFSLTGQPNAMGGREVGGLANLLPAHRDLLNADHRTEVEKFWNSPVKIASKPGLTATEMFDALADGRMKAIWIVCTNPLVSLPDARKAEEALKIVHDTGTRDARISRQK